MRWLDVKVSRLGQLIFMKKIWSRQQSQGCAARTSSASTSTGSGGEQHGAEDWVTFYCSIRLYALIG
jgi:hypothetical protein